ncbi:hypothetical protein PHYPO_G00008050 [Pangasianodon hypophthalmus]|uniref:Germ cell-specific gene 1-like protein n=1 Tax=Pangasianodon hypophthalmus TaxID=310915 RepID=A0A5N5Q6K4_PANHP|nr:hypothetical protein PHYPO_G00008050 [Pangasianodon hypophthalmus]
MLEHMPRRSRSLLCLSLTSLALALSVLAFCTSYWCEGTQKVVKPLCLSPVKMEKCSQNNSQPFAVGTVQPELPSNGTVSPNQREALTKTQQTQLANAVQYIWETGEDKYMFRYFHAGFWESCEKHADGERCRNFLDLTPEDTHGVLWLSMISEFIYIGLLGMGFLLMWLEVLCSHKEMYALKINAFAALCTVLSVRSNWDGGPYDVHHSFPVDRDCRTERLETSELGLWLVFCHGLGVLQLLYGCCCPHLQLLHQDYH